MREIQISSEYQIEKGVFRKLYGYVLSSIPENIEYVESYANQANIKSNGILQHLGLKVIGKTKAEVVIATISYVYISATI